MFTRGGMSPLTQVLHICPRCKNEVEVTLMDDEAISDKKVHCPACIREGRLIAVVPKVEVEAPRYSPDGFEQEFPIDMGKDSMKIETLLTLGRNAYRSKDYEKAIYFYDQVLAKSPGHKQAIFFRKKSLKMKTNENIAAEEEEEAQESS